MKAIIAERDGLIKERDTLSSQLRKLERQERDNRRQLAEQEWRWQREQDERKSDEGSKRR